MPTFSYDIAWSACSVGASDSVAAGEAQGGRAERPRRGRPGAAHGNQESVKIS
jgi:hypothetical protein